MTAAEWRNWIAGQGGLSSTPREDIQALLRDFKAAETENVELRDQKLNRHEEVMM